MTQIELFQSMIQTNAVKHTGYNTKPEQLYILRLGYFQKIILVRSLWVLNLREGQTYSYLLYLSDPGLTEHLTEGGTWYFIHIL
jgi:hypothetical protein